MGPELEEMPLQGRKGPAENNIVSPVIEAQTRAGEMAEQVKLPTIQTRGPEFHGSQKPRKVEEERTDSEIIHRPDSNQCVTLPTITIITKAFK